VVSRDVGRAQGDWGREEIARIVSVRLLLLVGRALSVLAGYFLGGLEQCALSYSRQVLTPEVAWYHKHREQSVGAARCAVT